MRKIFLLFLVASFLFLLARASATTFIATITPTLINSSVVTQVSLNITNLNETYNIMQASLTLPQNFTYQAGSCQPSENCSYSQNLLTWNYVIQNGSSFVFNFSIIANVNGTYYFEVSTLDSSGTNASSITNTFEVNDTKPPTWSSLNAPSTPTPYAAGEIYYFNITWDDNINISKVIFSWNGTANYTYPDVKNVSKVYSINLTDLAAGNYIYYWFANDTNGNSNQTSIQVLNITKADNPIDVYFNSTKNQNITVVNETTLTINATGQGNLKLNSKKANLENQPIPYPYTFTSLGMYDFTINATGNQNYTSNSSTYFVMVVPNYTISYSTPSTYSSTTSSSFSIDFSSYPEIDNLFLELDGTRYAMSNSSITHYSYSINLPAGSHSWKILGNYSNHIFNLTGLNSFTIQKASPSLSLTASPGWTVYKGNRTSVTCYSPHADVSLYRNGTLVNNPDVQTLGVGNYLYVCESTETTNYTSKTTSNILSVVEIPVYVADLSFTGIENLITVLQNSSNITIVKVKNSGNLTQTIYFWVENINSSWYSTNATNTNISPNKEVSFLVNFSVDEVEPKEYFGEFKVNSTQKSINHSFTLKVLPNPNFQAKIMELLSSYERNLTLLGEEINRTKSEGYNTSLAEQKLGQLKILLNQARTKIEENNYSSVYTIFNNIQSLIGEIKFEINSTIQKGKIQKPSTSFITYILIACVAGVCVFIAYLFWPTKEVKVATQMPVEKAEKNFFEKVKRFLRIEK
jgi:hypothetical protein